MQAQTLSDVIQQTGRLHRNLASELRSGSPAGAGERIDLLREYLAQSEGNLSRLVEAHGRDAADRALNTWCYEYLRSHSIDRMAQRFSAGEVETDEGLLQEVVGIHGELVALFQRLHAKADTEPTRALLHDIRELEESETRRMAQGANRLHEL
ncbi:hypothetical protein AWR36_006810 [Microbulbifer flavimaris]|uniref:ATPase n=1 Tax=Microbulbifer flavimaris TaxID=1781068 RepID=A0ABX4I2F0_9GAMM|nr:MULTISPECIES: hypothetical protein [Microbulbifer]KUJ83561.1 hypothetical protein AVO43_06800 [Microbulbifer sp. ZGT114]PCO05719.1 hypothetical protein AWR36_006810 [Microbulbifer flavimaris]